MTLYRRVEILATWVFPLGTTAVAVATLFFPEYFQADDPLWSRIAFELVRFFSGASFILLSVLSFKSARQGVDDSHESRGSLFEMALIAFLNRYGIKISHTIPRQNRSGLRTAFLSLLILSAVVFAAVAVFAFASGRNPTVLVGVSAFLLLYVVFWGRR